MNKVTTQERARYYEYRKSNIEHSERKSINTRGVWQIISCYPINCFKLGKWKKLS